MVGLYLQGCRIPCSKAVSPGVSRSKLRRKMVPSAGARDV